MRLLSAFLAFTTAALANLSVVAASDSTKTALMPFKECLAIIAEVTQETGAVPATLASTADLRAVRIDAGDGSVTDHAVEDLNNVAATVAPGRHLNSYLGRQERQPQ